MLHGIGGYLTYAFSTIKWSFNVKPDSIYWCNADIGWITGHTYVVYGPLSRGVTSVIFEGTPDFPHPGIWWSLIEKYKVNVLYTSPTALRMCKKMGDEHIEKYDLSSLKNLGSVGEPLNPEVYNWYDNVVGKNKA